MLKRQDSLLSSSRRQAATAATPPLETHRAKAVGCMSGILQLFSKHHNSNRRLTFERKHEKRKAPSLTKARHSAAAEEKEKSHRNPISDRDGLICDIEVPRSPPIPPEIRRSNSPSSSEDSRTPSSLVARLMGLEDIRTNNDLAAFEEDQIAKKRQRLLQALEKCNDDLKALKRIIKALQTGNVSLDRPPRGYSGGGNEESLEMESCVKCTGEAHYIPECAAAELSRSPGGCFFAAQRTNAPAVQVIPQQRKPTAAKKPGEDDEVPLAKLLNKCTFTVVAESSLALRQWVMAAQQRNSSRAMAKSVDQVCGDIAWGEKREIDRIGIMLQDHLCRDLIEDFAEEMMIMIKSCSSSTSSSSSSSYPSLPLEACKKRLRF